MAMDALKNIVDNVPDWLQRLDDLSGQIDRRQAELAAVAAAEGKNAETRSLRNKGPTESPKPIDDPASCEDAAKNAAEGPVKTETPKVHAPGSIHQQPKTTKERRAEKPAEGTVKQKRDMIIVYYDSYVSNFFHNLVRFVSLSGNLMRKAKMAARVAQAKKLAEQDVSEHGNNDDAFPSLRYMSSSQFGPMSIGRPGAGNQPPNVYHKLDKGLEFVQSMCEDGAHQFLCKGNCNDEIIKAQKRLSEVLEMAKTELERIEREEPELAKEAGEQGKVRIPRPLRMRRGMTVGLKEGSLTSTKEENKLELARLEAAEPTSVDESMGITAVYPKRHGRGRGHRWTRALHLGGIFMAY
ncbi:hypothetical protein FOVG_17922 [Fusarium oxysporum f. sp. pisi HDV247]|uniref:Uncharacterized protein n=1 Tax=Fusarium oxysporum f. sp. pisi HDV247 TaxID=1080344 RepID=W9ND59_FUSOX|nr:hypothetical protein FOVG_17922 [Fusarium oxysporum f. sp. pisi HDV247]